MRENQIFVGNKYEHTYEEERIRFFLQNYIGTIDAGESIANK